MGTANPGKSSGLFTLKGRVMEMGNVTEANDTIENNKLKVIKPLVLNLLIKPQKINAASKHTRRFREINLGRLRTIE
ncbi:MAG: hypothetical protein NVS1B13_23870 [Flavisolibacter sp.]